MIRIKSNKGKKEIGVLKPGDHVVMVESITETYNKDWADMPWDDKTPQIAIRFKNADGYITQWVNLKGYMTIEDYENSNSAALSGIIFAKHPFSKQRFAVDLKTNTRIENEDKSNTCRLILGRIANCCGVPPGEEISLVDLVGANLLIRVQNVNGQNKVTHTFKKV